MGERPLGPPRRRAEPAVEVGSRDWFEAYLAAFNRSDFAAFGGYYADDVEFAGQAGSFAGAAAVIAFYREVKARVDETLTLLSFIGDGVRIAAELHTSIVARQDWPEFPTGAMRAGDRRESTNFIFYDIADGRFVRIRSANFRRSGLIPA
ncbi:MAG: hypothetical protein JWM38_2577 [Sphingomonas bacterium]|nr:hypothetical protein [Sphingomonas bacterium]